MSFMSMQAKNSENLAYLLFSSAVRLWITNWLPPEPIDKEGVGTVWRLSSFLPFSYPLSLSRAASLAPISPWTRASEKEGSSLEPRRVLMKANLVRGGFEAVGVFGNTGYSQFMVGHNSWWWLARVVFCALKLVPRVYYLQLLGWGGFCVLKRLGIKIWLQNYTVGIGENFAFRLHQIFAPWFYFLIERNGFSYVSLFFFPHFRSNYHSFCFFF